MVNLQTANLYSLVNELKELIDKILGIFCELMAEFDMHHLD
jgi:hypothetical protein